MTTIEYASFMKEGGKIFINSNMVGDDIPASGNVEVVRIPCTSLAKEASNLKGANLVMVGAVIKKCAYFDKDFAIQTMKEYFSEKGKDKYNTANEAAFMQGFRACKGVACTIE